MTTHDTRSLHSHHHSYRLHPVRSFISLMGRSMITVGLILLLFVAYQLWGTNFIEARNQKDLRSKFEEKLDKIKTNQDNPVIDNSDNEKSAALTQEELKPGNPIAYIQIEKIGLDHVVVSGTSKSNLQKGPGHYPSTPLPGQFGNAAIAGHRTTYGAPFNRLNELAVGDKIKLVTGRGIFTYEIYRDPFTVKPKDVSVIEPEKDPSDPTGQSLLATLTLTTCHPKYSAAQRLIIKAKLVPNDVNRATTASHLLDKDGKQSGTIDIGDNDDTLGSSDLEHSNILIAMVMASLQAPLLWWFLLLLSVGSIWWFLFNRFRNWKVWFLGVSPFAVTLLFYFIHLEHALPSNI